MTQRRVVACSCGRPGGVSRSCCSGETVTSAMAVSGGSLHGRGAVGENVHCWAPSTAEPATPTQPAPRPPTTAWAPCPGPDGWRLSARTHSVPCGTCSCVLPYRLWSSGSHRGAAVCLVSLWIPECGRGGRACHRCFIVSRQNNLIPWRFLSHVPRKGVPTQDGSGDLCSQPSAYPCTGFHGILCPWDGGRGGLHGSFPQRIYTSTPDASPPAPLPSHDTLPSSFHTHSFPVLLFLATLFLTQTDSDNVAGHTILVLVKIHKLWLPFWALLGSTSPLFRQHRRAPTLTSLITPPPTRLDKQRAASYLSFKWLHRPLTSSLPGCHITEGLEIPHLDRAAIPNHHEDSKEPCRGHAGASPISRPAATHSW